MEQTAREIDMSDYMENIDPQESLGLLETGAECTEQGIDKLARYIREVEKQGYMMRDEVEYLYRLKDYRDRVKTNLKEFNQIRTELESEIG